MQAIGLCEVTGFTPSMVAADVMEKSAGVRIFQLELNDALGVVIKITDDIARVETAIAAGVAAVERMHGKSVSQVIGQPNIQAMLAINGKPEFNALIMQNAVVSPAIEPKDIERETTVPEKQFAIGLIETQGFVAVFEGIDRACKAADVEVVCKEKLGGGYITVVIKGDVAAVTAAVAAGTAHIEQFGKLIASHVIANPSAGVRSLLSNL